MRLFSILVTLALMLGLGPVRAADLPPGCDSCAIKVDSLDQPTRLVGKWLFTRDDSPANAAVDVDTSDTEVVTEVSGRGVGMDAVKGFLEREGGRVGVRFVGPKSPAGHRPFEFVIVLPASFAVAA